jgi:hypothetical protein
MRMDAPCRLRLGARVWGREGLLVEGTVSKVRGCARPVFQVSGDEPRYASEREAQNILRGA